MRTPYHNRIMRVAFFPDSFHEINGVAHTARQFLAYAGRHRLPMLCVRAAAPGSAPESNAVALELRRSRLAIGLERDLSFDPLFLRHYATVRRALLAFQPDVIHITGPSELGLLGALFAWRLGVPLAASWHTNLHEYAARRLLRSARRLHVSEHTADFLALRAQSLTFDACARFYRLARTLYAPNPELCTLLQQHLGRPVHLMERGVDTTLFTPAHRSRPLSGSPLHLGYVGRISVEKNVRLLPAIDRELRQLGLSPHWTIVGHGDEDPLLRAGLPDATFTGVLRGHALARTFADLDLLVFPSHTDTFGNVVLEALAAGVPAIVTPSGGPAHILRRSAAVSGQTAGAICPDDAFASAIAAFAHNPARLAEARRDARRFALTCSWDAVFDRVLAAYPTPA